MTRADNSAYLRAAAKERHEAALERSASALRSLEHAGLPVTFKSVAEHTGVVAELALRANRTSRSNHSFPLVQPQTPTGHPLRHNVRALPRCSRASTLRMQRSPGFELRTAELRHQVEWLLGERRMRR